MGPFHGGGVSFITCDVLSWAKGDPPKFICHSRCLQSGDNESLYLSKVRSPVTETPGPLGASGGLCEWEKTFVTEHWLLSHQRQQPEVGLLVSQHTWLEQEAGTVRISEAKTPTRNR